MSSLIEGMKIIFNFMMMQFGKVANTIMENPVLLLPVLLSLFSALIFFVVKIIKKLGLRGKRG